MDKPTRYRLKLNNRAVRMLYDEYKVMNGIPTFCSLSDSERGAFEIWAMAEARARGIDLFGTDEYCAEVLKANGRIMDRYNKR